MNRANNIAEKFKNEADQRREEIKKLENMMKQATAEAQQNMIALKQKYKSKISALQATLGKAYAEWKDEKTRLEDKVAELTSQLQATEESKQQISQIESENLKTDNMNLKEQEGTLNDQLQATT